MRKDELVGFFGNQTEAAKRLGITKSAVSQWGKIVPEYIAYRAQYESGGVLKVDPATYRKHTRHNGGATSERRTASG